MAAELDAFVARRLLSTDTDNGTVVIGVAHEAFLSAWPPLAAAITKNVSALRARRAVEHAAEEWHANGRPSARLWEGGQLAAAVSDTGARLRTRAASTDTSPKPVFERPGFARWLPRWHRVLVTDRVDLSPTARDFLNAGIRRDRYRHRRAATVLSVLLIVAVVAAGVAVVQQRRAEAGELAATARQLIAQAESARATDPRTALRLGLAAHSVHPDGGTHASLINTLIGTRYANALTGHTGSVWSVAFAPDGRTLATGSFDNTVILWDLADRTRPTPLGAPLIGHDGSVRSVAFAPDGRTLATGGDDNTVILWDLADRTRPTLLGTPLSGHTDWVRSVAFAPDGRTLATGSFDDTVILWDLADRTRPTPLGAPLIGHTDWVWSVAFAPDGRTLATGGDDNTVILWDLADRTRPTPLGAP